MNGDCCVATNAINCSDGVLDRTELLPCGHSQFLNNTHSPSGEITANRLRLRHLLEDQASK